MQKWYLSTGDISVTKRSRWARFLNRLRLRNSLYDYVVRIAIYPFSDPYHKRTVWFTPKKQYSAVEKELFVFTLTQAPSAMDIGDLAYMLVNTVRPNTFTSTNFTSIISLHTNPYYKVLSPQWS
jgi:hypothetical protein